MFRPMRRAHQQMSDEETKAILKRRTSGVLALAGDNGYPYAVPLSYVYDENTNRLIFHSAASGHKIDAIHQNPKASFCILDRDEIIADEYTTYFKSAIAFGTIRMLEGDEARNAAEMLGAKYRPGHAEELRETVLRNLEKMTVFALEIEHLTGKQAKELIQTK